MRRQNAAVWFEIPVTDMDRAIRFYERVLGIKLDRHTMGALDMAWFPWAGEASGAAGCLVRHPDFYRPSSDGVLVYLAAPSGDLSTELERVEGAGGRLLAAKKRISPEHGHMALLEDSEGNRVALHSPM
jgi:predicted enzyme related to lactoylglutathione lyase